MVDAWQRRAEAADDIIRDLENLIAKLEEGRAEAMRHLRIRRYRPRLEPR